MALPVRLSRERGQSQELSRNDFNTMLSRLFGRGLDFDDGAMLALPTYGVDIREDEDHIYVEADLPGFRKEDVSITLENGMLAIIAERREEIGPSDQGQQPQQQGGQQQQGEQAEGEQKKRGRSGQQRQQQDYLLRERRIQRYVRSFTLPPNVDEQHVQAKLEDGVLKIVLNKREESKPKKIQVS